jgi:hypothetical protein
MLQDALRPGPTVVLDVVTGQQAAQAAGAHHIIMSLHPLDFGSGSPVGKEGSHADSHQDNCDHAQEKLPADAVNQ